MMTHAQNEQTPLLKLYRLVSGGAVEICEISAENLTRYASTQSAQTREVCDLIEQLLAYLPTDEQQVFKQRIKTEGMI